VGARFSAPVQTGSEAYPASYTMGTVSFSGVKRPGRGVDHPPPSSADVKETVDLYLYSLSGPSMACCRENFTFTIHLVAISYLSPFVAISYLSPFVAVSYLSPFVAVSYLSPFVAVSYLSACNHCS
jgi:hypothetical protein